jgi:DNA-binding transcriptional ArsR family regulator
VIPEEAAVLLRTVANPARLRILSRLLDGEAGVGAIEQELDLRQPALSQHLGALRDAGLVATRRQARSIFYRLADGTQGPILVAILRALGGQHAEPAACLPRIKVSPAGRASAMFAVVSAP